MLAYVKMGRQTLILVPSSLMTMGEPTFHFLPPLTSSLQGMATSTFLLSPKMTN